MNPIDALDPNITDEKLAEFYGASFMDLVRDDYPISAVRNDDKIWAHQWLTDLMLQIEECKCEDKMWCDCLSEWDRIPDKVSNLLAEVKRLRGDMAYCASLITCMIDMGDPLSLFVVREGMLGSIGMTVDEAMATTDLMGDEEE